MKLSKIPIETENGITLISACKNRQHHLVKLLESISCFNEIDEIIIVDWSSDESLRPLIEKFQNGKIILAEVPGQDNFLRCHAFNLAARLATKDKLIKLDADIQVKGNFFARYHLHENSFYAGKSELAKDENEYGLTGLLYLRKTDFFNVNGYNEYLTTWGRDDIDLYSRLEKTGLKFIEMDYTFFYHMPHGERFLKVGDFLGDLNLSDKEMAMFFDYKTKTILESSQWSKDETMTDYKINKIDKSFYRCNPIDIDAKKINESVIDESNRVGLKAVICRKLKIPDNILDNYPFNEMCLFYDLCLNANRNTPFKSYIKYLNDEIIDRNTKIANIGYEYKNVVNSIKKSISWKIGSMAVAPIVYVKNLFVKDNLVNKKYEK